MTQIVQPVNYHPVVLRVGRRLGRRRSVNDHDVPAPIRLAAGIAGMAYSEPEPKTPGNASPAFSPNTLAEIESELDTAGQT
jgi:hypothetical protein